MEQCIYLDYAASTPLDGRVLKAMLPWISPDQPGNAHAHHHKFGAVARRTIDAARGQIANSIAAEPESLIFTSGATEANNLVLKGLTAHLRSVGRTHIITSVVEHSSVLAPIMALQLEGFCIDVLPVKPCGMIEAGMIERRMTKQTGLVSIQAVNNETGTIQPLAEIAAMLKRRNVLLHTDATQALGKTAFSVAASGADFASLSAHKSYGPQGIGALFVRPEYKCLLQPLSQGGGQEDGLRSGTLPVALCVGFGAACTLIQDDTQRLRGLREAFIAGIGHLKPVIYGHRDPAWNIPGIIALGFSDIDNETLVMALPDLAFGTGSACSSSGNKYSHVIHAIAGDMRAAKEAIRISFGRFTTAEQISRAAQMIASTVTDIRKLAEAA